MDGEFEHHARFSLIEFVKLPYIAVGETKLPEFAALVEGIGANLFTVGVGEVF